MSFFGVDPLNFTNEDDFWAEVSEAMSASFGPEYSEMGYDDLSNDYEPDPNDRTVAHIRCIEAGGCGEICVLDYQEYRRQMLQADDRWRCTNCGGIADWIALFVPCSQCGELVNYEEDDVCEHCGKVFYAVENFAVDNFQMDSEENIEGINYISLDGDEYTVAPDDEIPF